MVVIVLIVLNLNLSDVDIDVVMVGNICCCGMYNWICVVVK